MQVRDFLELGVNLKLIVQRLLNNQNLCKYLLYNDANPLAHEDIKDTKSLLHKRIRILPKVEPQDNADSTIVVMLTNGYTDNNPDFQRAMCLVYVYVPYEKWIINDDQLRPFAIMSEVKQSLDKKQIVGVGKLKFEEFSIDLLSDDMGAYRLQFSLELFN